MKNTISFYECTNKCSDIKSCVSEYRCSNNGLIRIKSIIEIYKHRFEATSLGSMFCSWKCNKCGYHMWLQEGRITFTHIHTNTNKLQPVNKLPQCSYKLRLQTLLL